MMFEVKHGFIHRSHDIQELFNSVNRMSTFMRKLEKQSIIDPLRYDPLKYIGDGFEMFTEIFLRTHEFDNRIGISKYEPVQHEDNGVDGIGYNFSGEKSAIQCKFRSNTNYLLTADGDHLANMIADALLKHDIGKPTENSKVPRYYIITTAKGLHPYTEKEFFKGCVKCFGYEDLRYLLDENVHFWNLCRDIAKAEVEKQNKN